MSWSLRAAAIGRHRLSSDLDVGGPRSRLAKKRSYTKIRASPIFAPAVWFHSAFVVNLRMNPQAISGVSNKEPAMRRFSFTLLALAAAGLTSCGGDLAKVPVSDGTGPNPTLPPAEKSLIPTVNIAPAKGWPPGAKPVVASDLTVTA